MAHNAWKSSGTTIAVYGSTNRSQVVFVLIEFQLDIIFLTKKTTRWRHSSSNFNALEGSPKSIEMDNILLVSLSPYS
jgi:hypothetical protein